MSGNSRYDPNRDEKTLAKISEENQDIARDFITAKRAEGLKPASRALLAKALQDLDDAVGGRTFLKIAPKELTNVVEAYARTHASTSTHGFAWRLKGFYTWANDDECPKPIARALFRPKPPLVKQTVPLSDDEWRALLKETERFDVREMPAKEARRRALLWMLWDTGFRISELLALRIRSFQPDDKGGALLTLPPDAPDLKTGPRTIYVVECIGAIKLWLAVHPERANPDAPLFPAARDRTQPMAPIIADKILASLSQRAGTRRANPHLFRHTRATRAAAKGWNESQMRQYFGWAPGSMMASHYVHLAQSHMEERVRLDAGLDQHGAPRAERSEPAGRASQDELADTIAATLTALDRHRSRRARDDDEGAAAAVARY